VRSLQDVGVQPQRKFYLKRKQQRKKNECPFKYLFKRNKEKINAHSNALLKESETIFIKFTTLKPHLVEDSN
jgi:hypothetical protein